MYPYVVKRYLIAIMIAVTVTILGVGITLADIDPSAGRPPPETVNATQGGYYDRITVTWDDGSGLSVWKYRVYRKTYPGEAFGYIGEGVHVYDGGVYHDYDVDLDKTYGYFVKACDFDGNCGELSDESSTGWVAQLPKPTGVVASESETTLIQVQWNLVSAATKYKIYRKYVNSDPFLLWGTRDVPGSSYWNDTSAVPGHKYYFAVKACNDAGCSEFSSQDDGRRRLKAPTGVQASDGASPEWVRVTWNPVEGEVWTYFVSRALTAGGVYWPEGSASGSPFYDETTSSQTFYYKVKACASEDSCSDESAYDSGHIAESIPPPGNVQASDGSYQDKVRVTWNAVPSALYYEVWRAESANGAKSWLADPVMTTFDDFTAEQGTTYHYFLKSCMYEYCSATYSAGDTGYLAVVPPAAPVDLQASDGTDAFGIVVLWSPGGPVSEVDYYRLERGTAQGSGFQLIGGNLTISRYDDGSVDSQTYSYRAQACNSAGCSGYSNTDTGYRGGPPAPPTNVQATDGTYPGGVQVTWDASSNAQLYFVYRHSINDPSQSTLIGDTTATSFLDLDPPGCNSSYYWVRASNSFGTSSFGNPDIGNAVGCGGGDPTPTNTSTPVSPPPSLTPTATADSPSTATATRAATLTPTRTQAPSKTNTPRSTPTATATRRLRDTATPTSTLPRRPTSTPTAVVNPAPLPPTDVTASRGTYDDKVRVKWSASRGATYYWILRASMVGGAKTKLAKVTDIGYDDTSAWPGTVYAYWLQACNNRVCGDYADYVRGYRGGRVEPASRVSLPMILRMP